MEAQHTKQCSTPICLACNMGPCHNSQHKEPSLVDLWQALSQAERTAFTREIAKGMKEGGAA